MGLRLNKRKKEQGLRIWEKSLLQREQWKTGHLLFLRNPLLFINFHNYQENCQTLIPEPNFLSGFSLLYLSCSWDLWPEIPRYSHFGWEHFLTKVSDTLPTSMCYLINGLVTEETIVHAGCDHEARFPARQSSDLWDQLNENHTDCLS